MSQHAQKIITLLILSLQVLSPFFHPSSAQDSDAYGGSYSNRNVYQFASRFVFLRQRTWPTITYIYIYIYTRFQKGFHIERYIDRYILLFSCTCARAFTLVIVQLVKKLGSTINFLFVRFFVPICQLKK